MRLFILTFFVSVIFTSCQTDVKTLGKKFTESNPISVDELISKTKAEGHLDQAQVTGKIDKSCRSEGCWFTIKDNNGAEVYLDIKDKGFKMPLNSPERQVVALVNADTSAAAESGISIDVKGVMFK